MKAVARANRWFDFLHVKSAQRRIILCSTELNKSSVWDSLVSYEIIVYVMCSCARLFYNIDHFSIQERLALN